jgi:hypothetical protein
MTMKITNFQLNQVFTAALREVFTMKTPISATENTLKTIKSVEKAAEVYTEVRKNIIETRAIKDDKGQFKTEILLDEKGKEVQSYVFGSPEAKKEVEKMILELENNEIEVEIYPIKKSDLGDNAISGASLMILTDKNFIKEN